MDYPSRLLLLLRNQHACQQARLQAIEQSVSWKATRPLRDFYRRHPHLCRVIRRALNLIWWTLTLRVQQRLREYLHASRPCVSVNAEEATSSSEATDKLIPSRTVSVIVPNYNYAQYLAERMNSIRAQTHPIHEVIFLDDASTDDSVAVIREIAKQFEGPLRVVVNVENSGSIAQQWERGVNLAAGELVWIAEADDIADPDFLAVTASAFNHSDVVLSYSRSRQIDRTGLILDHDYSGYLDDFDPERWQRDYRRPGTEEIAQMLSVGNTIPNVSAVVFRKSVLADVLKAHRDELSGLRIAADWCCYLHILTHGSIAFSAQVLNSHRRHQESVTSTIDLIDHVREIQRMQRLAAELVEVPPDRAVAARLWYAAWAEMAISALVNADRADPITT